jgi:hypothetical protein
MKNKNVLNSLLRLVTVVVVILFFAGSALFIVKMFAPELSRIYIVADGVRYDKSASGVVFPYREVKFEVGFSFSDFNDSLIGNYEVKIVPIPENVIDFTVDGELYSLSAIEDLTDCFSIEKGNGYFVIDFSNADLWRILAVYFDVELSSIDFITTEFYPSGDYRLIVTSGDQAINIDFYLDVVDNDNGGGGGFSPMSV